MDNTNIKKPKKRQSRKKQTNNSLDGKEKTPKDKKLKAKKCLSNDGIGISKQLAMKKQKQKTASRKRESNKGTKICPNGKPMPSLADLEKMYEDSDTDEPSTPKPEAEAPKTPMTPTKQAITPDNKLPSPNIVSKIAECMMEIISSSNPAEIFAQIPIPSDEPPPPVIPPKKRKKTEVPYIVGCKERPQVPYNPGTKFCKGDGDYGVDTNIILSDEEEVNHPKKRRKKCKGAGISKSIFNAQSDEIAENLKRTCGVNESCDSSKTEEYAIKPYVPISPIAEQLKSAENDSDDSFDSAKTVDYFTGKKSTQTMPKSNVDEIINKIVVLNASTTNGRPMVFSPLPSTSRDNETFIKNDKLLNDSLNASHALNETENTESNNISIKNDELSDETLPVSSTMLEEQNDTDVQIVDILYETIVVNDEETKHNSNTEINRSIERKPSDDANLTDDDCVIWVMKKKNVINENLTTIVIDDEYSNINIDDSYGGDVDEIIDVDSLIEENEAIIKKIDGSKRYDSVIEVVDVPNSPSPGPAQVQQPEPQNNSVIIENSGPWIEAEHNYSEQTRAPSVDIMIAPNSVPETRNSIGNIVADFFKRSQILNATNNVFSRIDNLINTLDCLLPNHTSESSDSSTQLSDDNNPSHHVDQLTQLQTTSTTSRNQQLYGASTSHAASTTLEEKTKKAPINSKTKTANENQSAGTDFAEKGTRNIGDCPICMDSLANNSIVSTICGHVFCLDCMKAAIRSSGKRCPTCRKGLKGIGYHQLYL